jgi:hypothetical protein
MIFLTDLSDLKALPLAAAIRNVSGCPIQPIVGGSTASRPGAGRMYSGSVQTQRRRPLALQVYMRGLSGLSANRRFVWSRPTNRSRWLRAAQATRRCGPIPANVAYTAPAIIPASSQPSRKCAGSKLPAAAEGYDTLAIRSGNALASASRLGAITPRSVMRPVTSRAGVTSKA